MYFKKLKIIFIISVIVLAASGSFAEPYNEDAFFKDYVSSKGEDLVIAVNRDTNEVELYWSNTNQTWLKPNKEEQLGLQRLYNKKIQLREMQNNLDRMHNETWYDTNQNVKGR